MKKLSLFLTFMLLVISVQAQYKRPYRVAYYGDTKSYLITNRGDGSILELDANYKVTKVVSGLTDPRDLVVGTISGSQGLLVIDNNSIVVYDASSFSKLITFSVPGAGEIEDIAIDPANPGFFYLSDVKNNKIIKGKVGPPPFFTPSYTTLVSTGLSRPKGLFFNNKDELLVVTDEKSAKVIRVDTSSGNLKTLMTPGLDSLNSITQDGQGNYYMTNWGDSYMYRCDKDFKNLTKLAGYNKPSGLITNVKDDLLIVLCYFCNKLEFNKLHYFEPSGAVGACVGDSLDVELSITANGIGTYGAGNKFEVEISDGSGQFTTPKTIGSVADSTKPDVIPCLLPKGKYGANHKFRIRSTNPVVYSSEMSLSVYTVSDLSTVTKDWSLCKGSEVNIGMSGSSAESYRWYPATYLDDSTISSPRFNATDTGTFRMTFRASNKTYGCSDSVEVRVEVNPNIRLSSLNRKVDVCSGDTVTIGVSSPYSVKWTPVDGLSDPQASVPLFFDTVDRKYVVELEDSGSGCKGKDSVNVIVHDLPNIEVRSPYTSLCQGDTVRLDVVSDSAYVYFWTPSTNLADSTIVNPRYSSNKPGVDTVEIKALTINGCITNDTLIVNVNPLPAVKLTGAWYKSTTSTFLNVDGTSTQGVKIELFAIGFDTVSRSLGFVDSLPVSDLIISPDSLNAFAPDIFAVVTSDSGCTSISNTVVAQLVGVRDVYKKGIRLSPNPASNSVTITGESDLLTSVEMVSLSGRLIKSWDTGIADVSVSLPLDDVKDGVYVLIINDSTGNQYVARLMVRH